MSFTRFKVTMVSLSLIQNCPLRGALGFWSTYSLTRSLCCRICSGEGTGILYPRDSSFDVGPLSSSLRVNTIESRSEFTGGILLTTGYPLAQSNISGSFTTFPQKTNTSIVRLVEGCLLVPKETPRAITSDDAAMRDILRCMLLQSIPTFNKEEKVERGNLSGHWMKPTSAFRTCARNHSAVPARANGRWCIRCLGV